MPEALDPEGRYAGRMRQPLDRQDTEIIGKSLDYLTHQLLDARACQAYFIQTLERLARRRRTGRCNFLLVGADSCGKRATAMYGLIGMAKLNGIDS